MAQTAHMSEGNKEQQASHHGIGIFHDANSVIAVARDLEPSVRKPPKKITSYCMSYVIYDLIRYWR